MADKEKIDLEQYMIGSHADLDKILQEVQVQIVRLVKKLRVTLDTIPGKITGRLKKAFEDILSLLDKAFRVDSLEEYQHITALCGKALADSLLQLQLGFGQLQNAIISAAAPIAQVLLPVLQSVVDALSGLFGSIGYVLRAFLFGQEEAEGFSAAVTGIGTAATAAKKTLAGFDQINRLGSSSSSGGIFDVSAVKPLTGQWKKLAQQLSQLLEPLKKFDLTPAAESLERLRQALQPLTRTLFAGLEWAWYNLFIPLAQWTVEELLPVFLDTLKAALQALSRVIEELKPAFTWLWENCLQPLARWAGDQVIAYLQGIIAQLTGVSDWTKENQGPVERLIETGKALMGWVTQAAAKTMSWASVNDTASASLGRLLGSVLGFPLPLGGATSAMGLLTGAVQSLAESFGLVDSASGNTWSALQRIWQSAWAWLKEKAVDPAFSGVKNTINGVIALINGLLRGVTAGLNYLSRSMNKFSFELPDWIPLMGGKSFSFGLQQFTAPQIPYLAQGAVLPANKPFLAMVGDQRHGTNVEAPLATIQEAVSVVMEDLIASNLAGHEATVAVLREILQAVLGIQIGDDVIAGAVERHNRKMALVWGGY